MVLLSVDVGVKNETRGKAGLERERAIFILSRNGKIFCFHIFLVFFAWGKKEGREILPCAFVGSRGAKKSLTTIHKHAYTNNALVYIRLAIH